MKRSIILLVLLSFILTGVPVLHADEGMWTFDNPPLKQWKERYNFEPTKEWLDHRTGRWHFIADGEPPRIEIGNARLNGLCAIIDMIRVETSVRFNTYANEPKPAEEASLGRDVKDDGWFYPM